MSWASALSICPRPVLELFIGPTVHVKICEIMSHVKTLKVGITKSSLYKILQFALQFTITVKYNLNKDNNNENFTIISAKYAYSIATVYYLQ